MNNYTLKLKTKLGHVILKPAKPLNTIADLKCELSKALNIAPSNLYVLHGFPPKRLDLSTDTSKLEASNVCSGDTLIVESRIMDKTDTKEEKTYLGKALEASNGVSHIIEENVIQKPVKQEENHSYRPIFHNPGDDHNYLGLDRFPRVLLKKVVPADNSCLFTSIGFVMAGSLDLTCAPFMREIISVQVTNNLEEYNEAILGKTNVEYGKWIKRPESWGGAIELAVLSKYFKVEIAVVDTVNGILSRFGEDQCYEKRVFLIFDGVHYDPLYIDSSEPGEIQTIFSILDEAMLRQALAMALEAKSSHQFTDVNKFHLICQDCKKLLIGETGALAHAKETGHTNFGECK